MSEVNTQPKRREKFVRKSFRKKEEVQFETVPVSIRRVAKVGAGSKRLRFSVAVVIGDKNGKVGIGLGKGPDVRSAMEKGVREAKHELIDVKIVGTTIPHETEAKVGAARVFLKPALPGTGVIAGGSIRTVVELAGIKDLLSKRYGSNNQLNNVYATLEALKSLEGKKLDDSWKVKPMVSTVIIEKLSDKDNKVIEKKRTEVKEVVKNVHEKKHFVKKETK